MRRRARAAAWLACLIAAGCATAGTARLSGDPAAGGGIWATFKGSPERTGVVRAGVQAPLRIAWTYAPEGPTNGFLDWGPAAAGGLVFTPNGLNRVVALDAATGAVRWQRTLESNVFSVTLSPDGRRLMATTAITASPSPTLFALDPRTGEALWNNMDRGQPAIGGIESAPVVDGRRAYVAFLRYDGRGGVCAYDAASGSLLWQFTRPGLSAATPLALSGQRLYVGFDDRRLVSLDAKTGQLLWETGPHDGMLLSAPVVSGRRLFVAWHDRVAAFDSRTGRLAWEQPLRASVDFSSPALHQEVLYVGTREGEVLALRAADGGELWRRDAQVGALNASPVVDAATGLVWIGAGGNVIVALDAVTGDVVVRQPLAESAGAGVWRSAPALHGGRLFIGSLDKHFYALEPSGELF